MKEFFIWIVWVKVCFWFIGMLYYLWKESTTCYEIQLHKLINIWNCLKKWLCLVPMIWWLNRTELDVAYHIYLSCVARVSKTFIWRKWHAKFQLNTSKQVGEQCGKLWLTDGDQDGGMDVRTDGHHHTIIRPVWRRAYKKVRQFRQNSIALLDDQWTHGTQAIQNNDGCLVYIFLFLSNRKQCMFLSDFNTWSNTLGVCDPR